jgi:hypothetical protein
MQRSKNGFNVAGSKPEQRSIRTNFLLLESKFQKFLPFLATAVTSRGCDIKEMTLALSDIHVPQAEHLVFRSLKSRQACGSPEQDVRCRTFTVMLEWAGTDFTIFFYCIVSPV